MDAYEPYCLADSLFYDKPTRQQTDLSDFPMVDRPVPAGWARHESDVWMYYGPADGPRLPDQGWKVHVSACLDDAERALEACWDYCLERGVAFKYLRGRSVLMLTNSKSASRGGSGKLVTVYPRDEAELETVLRDLDERLAGVQGPYILSDLRYGEGPLFVRYGGFTDRKCIGKDGELVPAIENGDGELVPDIRTTTFGVPEWTTLPAVLEPHLAARNAVTTNGLPYDVENVLHFSNGGGVYLGRDRRTGDRVVLKEGRPYAGLDAAGRHAVTRLEHERDILERLAGLDVVPAVLDYFVLGEHHFLVEEFIDGNPLQRLLVERYPLTRATCTEQDVEDYTAWALDAVARTEDAVRRLHERGVVFGDLHPNNVLVTGEGRFVLIDFEVATLADDDARAMLANPAFAAPRDRSGTAVDEYALACLRLGMFAPMTTVALLMHRPKVKGLADLVAETFPVPRAYLDEACAAILGDGPAEPPPPALAEDPPPPGAAPWCVVRDALHRAILASATPERDDRLFPGDVAQFSAGGGVNIAHGAAGVLYALAETGSGTVPDYEDWLCKRVLHPEQGVPLGFYDGLHGTAYVLERLGRRQEALDVVDICLRENWELLGDNLYSGIAGIGLNLLHLGDTTGEAAFGDTASRIVQMLGDRLGGPGDVPEISGGRHPRAGLMHGSSGPALLFLHAYERTGDTALLDRAADALRQDLRRCKRASDGSLQVNQDWRLLPYLDEGSVGIGLVVARYLAHRRDEEFERARRDLAAVARSRFFVQPGLFTGRAGIIAALAMGLRDGQDDGPDPLLDHHVRGLRWHALPYTGGLAFTGDQLLRMSMDLATGTAGVLFALGAALAARRPFLPFVGPFVGAEGALAKATPPAGHDRERFAHTNPLEGKEV
ncbi:class III lanthionine synthetase LanKC [Actinomadura parmotrematis]|uniref:non-specific serine/threonine protein kinase n=1 Tax=Actinomadura parmotrematis TaxID=2864039 RepID=A0ABS7FTH4_9ACTN|nr:class III lanthionine synthetase LanKC [Actinomadura parmotrematis]MBW8483708.1 class III lanthionine synthetase LanKC [Actinomadura parmotrematis]